MLARLILAHPSIALIDEGTSALDSKTERDIKRSIAKVFSKCTVMVIAYVCPTLTTLPGYQ